MYIAIHFSHCNELHDSIVFIVLLLIIVYNYPGRDVISIHVGQRRHIRDLHFLVVFRTTCCSCLLFAIIMAADD